MPINELLAEHGVTLAVDDSDNHVTQGMTVTETGEGLKVNKILRGSVASEAGISKRCHRGDWHQSQQKTA